MNIEPGTRVRWTEPHLPRRLTVGTFYGMSDSGVFYEIQWDDSRTTDLHTEDEFEVIDE